MKDGKLGVLAPRLGSEFLHVWYSLCVTLIFNRCSLHEITAYLFREILGALRETWLVVSFCRTPAQAN